MFFHQLRQRMKGIIILVCAAFALTLLYVGGSGFIGSRRATAEAVAKVNGVSIDQVDLQQAYFQTVNFYRQFGQNVTQVQREDLEFSALKQLVDYQIMLQAAKDERIAVDNGKISDQIKQIKENLGDNYQQALQQQGMTEKDLRSLLRDQLLVQGIREQKSQVEVTDAEVKQAFDESRESFHVRHILIEPPTVDGKKDWDKALEEAKSLRARIKAGEDFAALAKENSDDPGSKDDGGDLGWMDHDTAFVPEFKDAVFNLNVGDLSEPVRTQFGYHLIEVTESKVKEGKPFDEVKESLRESVKTKKSQDKLASWMEKQREAAKVEILDPQLRAHQFASNDRLDQAIAQYKEAITAEPQDPYLYYHLARALGKVDAKQEAVDNYKKAAEMAESDPQLWFALGSTYYDQEKTDEAKDAFAKASEFSPGNLSMHQLLASMYTKMGETDLAQKEKDKVDEISQLMAERARKQQEQLQKQQELQKQLEDAKGKKNDQSGDQAKSAENTDAGSNSGDSADK